METVQIRVTKELLNKADNLVSQGLYSSRSEIFRDGLRRLEFIEQLQTNKQKEFNILFTADIHGNKTQYKKLFDLANEEKIDAIIIGGDIAPKDAENRTPSKQLKFMEEFFIPLVKKFKDKNQNCKIFIIHGNDDFKNIHTFLNKKEFNNYFSIIDNKVAVLHENFKIIGYPYVPINPFIYQDWVKVDANKVHEKTHRTNYITEGQITKGLKQIKNKIDLNNRKSTIEKDLINLLKKVDPAKTILIAHTPPYETNLDIIHNDDKVGSLGLKNVINEFQPLATFHGHIHETVKKSGSFKDKIGKTKCFTAGNDFLSPNLTVLIFNLFDIDKVIRRIV